MNRRNLVGQLALLAVGAALAFATFLALPAVFRFVVTIEPAEVTELRRAPNVARVETPVRPHDATRRIIHVLDYHWVPCELHEGPEPYEQHLRTWSPSRPSRCPCCATWRPTTGSRPCTWKA
jgi:hypothetical protein